MLAVAEMYIKGVSTREVEAVMREFGIESLSSSQVSRAAKLLDDELEAWRNRPLGEIRYLILDARYEKMRHGGIVRDAAVLSAIGIGPDERRRVLGVSVALSEAEVHWRAFLESLQARGMRGVEYVVSDDHAGLRAARRAVLGGAKWQRCQFHLARNAIHHAPSLAIRKRIGAELRAVWNAASLAKAETALAELVAAYRDTAPKLAGWLEENVPEGLAVFLLPEHHRRRMRTSNPMERAVQQELKRRTVKVRVFPERGRPRAPRQRRPRRDRRKMGLRHQGLHQVGMPGCVTTPRRISRQQVAQSKSRHHPRARPPAERQPDGVQQSVAACNAPTVTPPDARRQGLAERLAPAGARLASEPADAQAQQHLRAADRQVRQGPHIAAVAGR
jgi:putative transposase